MDIVANAFVTLWGYAHGSPKIVSADVEFVSAPFKDMLRNHGILFEERPARRHNKIGIVESGHNGIRLFVQRLLKDAEYNLEKYGLSIPKQEILSKATFLCNTLRGNAKLSSFELARGYSPSLAGLPQTNTSKEMLAAYYEQQSKRALTRMLRSHAPRVIKLNCCQRRRLFTISSRRQSKESGKKVRRRSQGSHCHGNDKPPRKRNISFVSHTKTFVWSRHRHYSTILKGLNLNWQRTP